MLQPHLRTCYEHASTQYEQCEHNTDAAHAYYEQCFLFGMCVTFHIAMFRHPHSLTRSINLTCYRIKSIFFHPHHIVKCALPALLSIKCHGEFAHCTVYPEHRLLLSMCRFTKRMRGFGLCIHTCVSSGACMSNATKTALWRMEGSGCSRHIRSRLVHSACHPGCPGYMHLGSDANGNISKLANASEHKKYVPLIRKEQMISDEELAYLLDLANPQTVGELYPMPGDPMEQDAGPSATLPPAVTITEDVDMRIDEAPVGEDGQEGDESDMHTIPAIPQYVREHSIASSTSDFSQLPLHSTAQDHRCDQSVAPKTFRILYIPDPSRARGSLRDADADLAYTTRSMPKEDFDHLKSVVPKYLYLRRSQSHDHESQSDPQVRKVRISEWVWYQANHM